MAISETSRLLADARTHLPGALIESVRAEFFASCREFLDFTNVWQEDINVVLVVGQRTYTLTAPAAGRINRLLVLYDPQATDPLAPAWVTYTRMDQPGQIFMLTYPNKITTWVARVAKVTKDVDGEGNPVLDDWIVQKYWNALLWGTLSKMMAQSSKPWSNPQSAMFHGKNFVAEKTKARKDAMMGNVYGQLTWSYHHASRGSQRGV